MIFKKTAKNLTKKNGLRKAWKNKHRAFDGKKIWAQSYAQHIGTDPATGSLNSRLPLSAHRVIEEVREAMTLWGGKPSSTMRYDDAPRGCMPIASDRQEMIWGRFSLWYSLTAYYARKERDAVILLAEGYGVSEIESLLKIRRGHGKARKLIEAGIREYCEISGIRD